MENAAVVQQPFTFLSRETCPAAPRQKLRVILSPGLHTKPLAAVHAEERKLLAIQ